MGRGFNRQKENYYMLTLYFSSAKKDEVALYFFLKQLARRRKATGFITKILTEYLLLCGHKDPMALEYDEADNLPSITELMDKNKNSNTIPVNFMDMFATLMNNSSEKAQKEEIKIVDTPKPAHVEEKVEAPSTQKVEEPEIKMDYEMEREAEPVQDENEDGAISADWLQGLSAFTGE